ncbi:MAG: PAS domain-containing protein [Chloroflexales bacterium]|nr:PAS domain-containing protein [Chloroflexales bacterium]
MDRRIYDKLSLRLLVVALAPALLVSATLSAPMIGLPREQMLEQATERVVQASRTTEAIYQERMAFAALLAELLAELAAFVQAERPDDPAALAAFVRETRAHTLFDLVTLVDAGGGVVAQDGATRLWRGLPSAPLTVWGAPGLGLVVEVRAPILDPVRPARTFAGSFALDAPALTLFRERTGLEQSLLVDGRLVATSLPARVDGLTTERDAAVDLATLDEPRTLEVRVGEVAYLARYKPLRDPAGRVVTVAELLLPLAPVRAAQQQATALLLVISALAVLAATLFAITLARWVSRPIQQLGWASAALGRGELAQPVQVRGPTELIALGEVLETARRQLATARTALAEEKERYASILESIGEALITVDAWGCVTGMNSAAERLLGMPGSSALGRPLSALLPTGDGHPLERQRIPFGSTLRVALRGEEDPPRTVAITRCLLLGRPGSAREEVLVLRDISDEVAVSQLKEAFLANITHEFQTPLAALLASLELLREEDERLTASERGRLLETSATGTRRLQQLVANLLDSASLQAGYFRVEPELSTLRPLVAEAVATVEPVARQRGQQIAVALPAQLPPILADEPRLVQAIVNLLANASKFGPPDDTIQLRVTTAGGTVRIAVTDHGPGVVPARQRHLFERFLRPGSATERAQGAGLGLAITRAIVERHGGAVMLEPGAAGATTFVIALPQAPVDEEELDEVALG